MNLWCNESIQYFLTLVGYDLGSYGIDGVLGDYEEHTFSRNAISDFQSNNALTIDRVWGIECQTKACELLTNGIQLSEHFNSNEFGCSLCEGDSDYPYHSDGCNNFPEMPSIYLINLLEVLRNELNSPLFITSGVRCQVFNDTLPGSVSNSRHLYGFAVDCYTNEWDLPDIIEKALSIGFNNGSYVGNGFVHLQIK